MLCGASVATVGRQQWQSSCCHTSCSYWWNYRRVQAGHSSLSLTLIHPSIDLSPMRFSPLSLAYLARLFFSYLPLPAAFFLFFHMLSHLPVSSNLISFYSSFIVIPQLPLFFHLCHLLFYWKAWESTRRYKEAPTKYTCLISFSGWSHQHLWFYTKFNSFEWNCWHSRVEFNWIWTAGKLSWLAWVWLQCPVQNKETYPFILYSFQQYSQAEYKFLV